MEQKVHCLLGASYANIASIPAEHKVVITSEFSKFKSIEEIIQFEQDKTYCGNESYADFHIEGMIFSSLFL